MKPPKIAIVTISGFTQLATENSGTQRLRNFLYSIYGEEADIKVYELQVWKLDTKKLARRLMEDGITHCIVIGYSWGGGYGTPKLVNDLIQLRIKVPLVLLCDAVYRPLWLPTWGPANPFGFRALMPAWPIITLHEDVGRVKGVRQENNLPQSHRVRIGESGRPFWPKTVRRTGVVHDSIDDPEKSPEWKTLVDTEVRNMIQRLRLDWKALSS